MCIIAVVTLTLQNLYESIRSTPFQYHHGVDELTEVFFNPDHEGYLVKEGTHTLSTANTQDHMCFTIIMCWLIMVCSLILLTGGKHKSWRKRWFVLTDNCLYYFKSPSDKEPRGIIPLENLEVRECFEAKRNVSVCLWHVHG